MRLIEMMDYCWSYFLDMLFYGPVAQLVRAPPCHGGGRRFESVPGRFFQEVVSVLIETASFFVEYPSQRGDSKL